MIVIAGSVTIRPEQRAEATRAALAMARATSTEPGCISYRFASDLGNPDTFLIFEEWESDEALARHFQSEHMRTFREQLPKLVAGPARIARYTVSDKTAM
jgi:quinol monooxygenase YgiN